MAINSHVTEELMMAFTPGAVLRLFYTIHLLQKLGQTNHWIAICLCGSSFYDVMKEEPIRPYINNPCPGSCPGP